MSSDDDRVKKQREAGERESEKLWRAWRTVHEMVQDRGYQLSDEEVKIPLDKFKDIYAAHDGSIEYASLPSHSSLESSETTTNHSPAGNE